MRLSESERAPSLYWDWLYLKIYDKGASPILQKQGRGQNNKLKRYKALLYFSIIKFICNTFYSLRLIDIRHESKRHVKNENIFLAVPRGAGGI